MIDTTRQIEDRPSLMLRIWYSTVLPTLVALIVIAAIGIVTYGPIMREQRDPAFWRCVVKKGTWVEIPLFWACFENWTR